MRDKLSNPIIAGALALLCCLLGASTFPCVKLGYEWLHIDSVGSQILFAGYRFFLAGILAFVLGGILERKILTIKRKNILAMLGQGTLQTTIQYFCFYIGMASVSGAKGSIIYASNAFLTILAANFMLKDEKMTSKKWAGCFLGILGVIVVNLVPGAWGNGFSLKGEGMMLLCALAYGISSVTLKKLSGKESALTITTYQLLFGGGLLILIGKIFGGYVESFTIKAVLLLLYMAFVSVATVSIWVTLLRYNPVGKIAVYTFSIPVFGVFLSGMLLEENVLSMRNFAALLLVSAGIILINKSHNHIKD